MQLSAGEGTSMVALSTSCVLRRDFFRDILNCLSFVFIDIAANSLYLQVIFEILVNIDTGWYFLYCKVDNFSAQ